MNILKGDVCPKNLSMAEETPKQNKNGTDIAPKMEANEEDPCIEEKPISSRRRFIENTEQKLRQKSGLSRTGLYIAFVVLFLSLVLLILVISLIASWPRRPHRLQFPVCTEAACLRAAAQIQDFINTSLTPCDDIWSWSCGKWLSTNPLPPERSVWSVWEQQKLEEVTLVRDLVTTFRLPLYTTLVEWKLKHFYEACTEVDNVNVDQARPLLRIVVELGGWHILRNWQMMEFDQNVVLKQLHVKYGVSPYFKISVQPNPRLRGRNTITISPSGLGLPDRSYYYTNQDDPIQAAYKQMIRDVVINLSVTKTEAEKFGDDMFYYEKRIAEITPPLHELLNPVNTYNTLKISELKLTTPNLPILDILSAMYPEAHITEETEVIVTSPDYLNKVGSIVATTDRTTVNGYIIWTLIRKYLPYLSYQFTKTVELFQAELLGFRHPVPRWEKCATLIREFMGLAVQVALENKHPINHQTKATAEEVFERIRNTVEQKLQHYKVSNELQQYLTNKVSKLKLQIGLPSMVKSQNYTKLYYSTLSIFKSDLFLSFQNALLFQQKVEERLLIAPHPQDILTSLATQNAISYSPSTNTIIIPRGSISSFENGQPSSIVYGKLGVEIAKAIISSVLPYESAWNADLKLLSPFHFLVNESHESVDSGKKCLADFLTNKQLAAGEIANLTSLSTLKQLSAIRLTHQALLTFLIDAPHVHQPSLEQFEDSALFFLSYTQAQCSVHTKQQELYDNKINYELPRKTRLLVAWHQIPEFSTAFECAVRGSKCNDIF